MTIKKNIFYHIAFGIICLMGCKEENKQAAESPIEIFSDARFGMFIHWDMSSVAGTEISWSRKGSKPLDITGDTAGYVADTAYDNLYKKFNPTNFDAAKWVQLAKDAGMKYIVFTAKHHGGFCMWDTKQTDYNIMSTSFHRDVVKELSEACRKAGLMFGLYYSPRDWHQPDYGIGDNKKYVAYMNNELRELLTNYGKVDIIWWDSYGKGNLDIFWRIGETYKLVKELQPDIMMNNRLAELGDYNKQPEAFVGDWDTPEQTIGNFQNNRHWESCMSIVKTRDGGGWSYRPDGTLRSFDECIHALVSCAVGDGNLLLDVGPNQLGEIPADQSARLLQMGDWLKKYGKSIYGTYGGPYKNGEWGGSTYTGKTIYLHIERWNEDKLLLPALHSKVLECSNLSNAESTVAFEQTDKNLIINLPSNKQDSIDTIVELKLDSNASNEMKNNNPIEMK